MPSSRRRVDGVENLIHALPGAVGNGITTERCEGVEAPVPQILRHVEEDDRAVVKNHDVPPPFLGIDRQHHRISFKGLAPHLVVHEVLLELRHVDRSR